MLSNTTEPQLNFCDENCVVFPPGVFFVDAFSGVLSFQVKFMHKF